MKPTSYLLTILFLFCLNSIYAQNKLWQSSSESNLRNQSQKRTIVPEKYAVFAFDFDAFKSQVLKQNRNQNIGFIMNFPLPNSRLVDFEMIETNIFEKELADKYPGYTSFTGTSNDLKGSLLKMSVSPFGVNVMILSEVEGSIFIDPYTPLNEAEYIVYYKKDYKNITGKFSCDVKADNDVPLLLPDARINDTPQTRNSSAGDCTLRTYRLALACTGEYASYHGGTVEKVLAAYNTSMTRVNGIYERDVAINMKLVANTDKLIYLNASTDPYTNTNGSAMLGQNQSNIDNVIGFSNYDIGHVFSTGGGGIAQLRAPCSSSKAQGVTGSGAPKNDPFDVDYVAHEMGHQFGANHTQNNSCQRNASTAVEPGSASTIMGYAGICTPDVQNNSDAHFHGISIGEITNFIVAGQGNTCAVRTPTNNFKPEVSTVKNSYTIPVSTSFFLDAIATDPNGGILTYCWEQTNNQTATMPPKSSNTSGPTFRSLPPTISSVRYFPDLQNKYSTWEVLPAVTRTMNFRCTVRDNHIGGGCTGESDVEVKTNSAAGPFIVLNPNTAVSWQVGSPQTITWDVSKTDISPINCSLVTIKLSTDGGFTYPHIMASNIPNNGSFAIETPNLPSTKARVMVVSDGNIFFDVSNTNFAITSTFAMSVDNLQFDVCQQDQVVSKISLEKLQNPTQSIILSLESIPADLQYNFDNNPVALPGTSNLTLSNLNAIGLGNHNIKLIGAAGNEKLVSNLKLFVGNKTPAMTTLISPSNYKQSVDTSNIVFTWNKIDGVKSYDVDISYTPSFNSIYYTGNFKEESFAIDLPPNSVYYWRVKGNSPCVENPYGPTFSFKTSGSKYGSAISLVNNVLLVIGGMEGKIDQSKIDFISYNDSLSYITITELPIVGKLLLSGNEVFLGERITLADIKNEKFNYQAPNIGEYESQFKFDVVDEKNRWLPNQTFLIKVSANQPNPAAYIEQNIDCFGDSNGLIRVEAMHLGSKMYSIDSINYQESNTFTNLSPGSYTVYVKSDTYPILKSNTVVLRNPTPINLEILLKNYDIEMESSGGTGIISYSTNDSDYNEFQKIVDPGNGQYNIYAKDELGCKVNKEIEIDILQLMINTDITNNILCAGSKATLVGEGSGGIPPYTYSIDGSTYQSNTSFLVDGGDYVMQVKDKGNKIVASDTIRTSNPSVVTFSLATNKLNVIVVATGGTGSYTYSSDDIIYQTSDTVSFADNGTYRVYVKDSNGCVKSNTVSLNFFKDVQKTIRQITCFQKNDGYIKLLAENGAFPFKYSLNDSPLSSTREWSNLSAGDYKFLIIDGLQDSVTGNIIITEPDSLKLNFLLSGNNLTIEVTGGTAPYNYSIDGGIVYLGTNKFDDLPNNTYNIAVKDKNGCIAVMQTTITAVQNILPYDVLSLSPNPANEYLVLTSDELLDTNAKIKLNDLTGQNINTNGNIEKNGNQWTIQVEQLSSGLYILELSTSNGVISKKFIKI